MAYRIIYESEKDQMERSSNCRRFLLTVCFFLCFVWSAAKFWPEGRELLRILLIPGDPDMTLEAIEVFAQELGCGYPIKDAVQNFFNAVL